MKLIILALFDILEKIYKIRNCIGLIIYKKKKKNLACSKPVELWANTNSAREMHSENTKLFRF